MASDVRIVIVGGSHAGISAAVALKKKLPDAHISVIDQQKDEDISFVGADGLLWVSDDIEEQHMTYTNPSKVRKKGIEFHSNLLAVNIDFDKRIVHFADTSQINYDYLVLATGSNAIIPESCLIASSPISINGHASNSLPNNGLPENAIVIKTKGDAYKLKKFVDDENIKTIGIIGGGYIGVETVETLVKANANLSENNRKKVTVFQGGSHLVNTYYDAEFCELVEKVACKNDVELRLGERFAGFDSIPDGEKLDAYVLSLGFRANAELGKNKIELVNGAYDVNEFQETSLKNVFAIGDCSVSYSNALQKKVYIAIGSNTARESSIVAERIASIVQNREPNQVNRGTQGSNALSVFGLNLASVGITYEVAQKSGYNAQAIDFTSTQLAPYLPPRIVERTPHADKIEELDELAGGKVKFRLVFDADTRRILGAQMATHTDTIYALHLFSLAIERGLTVDEIRNLDLYFLPQFNQLYNILTRALNQLDKC